MIFFVCVIIIKEKENKKTGGGKRRRFPPPVSQKERMISMYADMLDTIGFVAKYDPELGSAMQEELARQRRNIELIASENLVSPAVMAAMGSVLTNKYAEGYPGKRYYGGCQCVDKVENLAIERAKKLFGAEHANVQPHSGAQANMAVYFALIQPGDTVLGMNLAHGGHLTHGSPVNMSGTYFQFVPYGVDAKTGTIDYDELTRLAMEHKPKLIVAGASAYARAIDFAKFREVADACGAYLMVDMAHIAGLVAAGLHQSPVPYADVVTTTTHKTLRGPRGGMILCREALAKQIDKPEFKEYQKKIVENAAHLAHCLTKEGFDLVGGGTDNHLLLLDLRSMNITGKELERRLDEVYITVNKNAIPDDPQKPFVTSGIRVGTPYVTSRGFGKEEMEKIARWIYLAATDFENAADQIRAEVNETCAKFPLYE